MQASKRSHGLACLTACLGFLALLSAGLVSLSPEAQAQSSVRPPAGATTNAAPNPGISRGDVPSRANQPTDVTGGNVPGGSLGTASDSELWRAVRQGIKGTVSIPDKNAALLVQSEGDNWRAIRNGPLANWGAWGLAAILVLLALFMLLRGRIRIDAGRSGRTILRFTTVERMAHWLLAVSFIVLSVTGLNITYGKHVLMPVLGKEIFATITQGGKWVHNYVAFAFMVGLAMIFVLWIKDNFPNKYDLQWIAKGGGIFTKSHPPSKKFNAGQKLIFWLVILGGASLSLSGIALLFPFQMSMFADTFVILNKLGFDLPTTLAPVQEMQYATTWHAIMALVLIVVIIAHIYIGSIGMEGAFDAMGTGEVDVNWAKEHHSVWTEEVLAADKAGAEAAAAPKAAPAE
ncbi:MAG: formate dehydrogenase subunit gamma [Hyphomicrobiales bacterium]|nr:formate dehydrogenase subunit gamma [Hyphomicrobiales bacterium]